MSTQAKTCPSAPCEVGSSLLGIVNEDGTVGYIRPLLPITPAFVAEVQKEDISPTKKYRFSAQCVENACLQWSEGRCGVIDRLSQSNDISTQDDTPLPRCDIRRDCRWFAQLGPGACRVCPYVITDKSPA